MDTDLNSPELYLNRELSWLEFNRRVLSLATRDDVPLVERLKFIAIATSNLDEFYMVRVGGLEREARRRGNRRRLGPDGLRAVELLGRVGEVASALSTKIAQVLTELLLPALREHGVYFLASSELSPDEVEEIRRYYQREVHPCLTPIAIDPTHPFPMLRNGSLNIALRVRRVSKSESERPLAPPETELLAFVQVPSVLPRFVRLASSDGSHRFVALEDTIALFAESLFPGHSIIETAAFRVTRASDLDISEEEAENLLSTIQDQLRQRERGEPVRLELSSHASDELTESLREMIGLAPAHIHRHPGYVATNALSTVYRQLEHPELRDEPFTPARTPELQYAPTIFRSIRERDILLHHPYESFRHVVDFIEQAAADPNVVAIKQTLYRTSGDSPIIRALKRAAEAGKQVTALVELKARFDEAANIAWAQALEDSGAHVVYGLIGLKTHCKLLLVIRRESGKLKRYCHLATGNYNALTARLYTDLGMFTARDDITADAMLLFNVLTGYADLPKMRHLVVAPFTMRQHTLDCIDREIKNAKLGKQTGIRAKMNALVDEEVIQALYRASRAGVKVDLMVRGICCLRPGLPGISENIRVKAIVDRFLEHARIFWWQNGGEPEVYLSSADWMPRNLNRRIEVSFPVLEPELMRRVVEEILPAEWEDNTFAWELRADGTYDQLAPGDREPRRAQTSFLKLAEKRSRAARASLRPEVSAKSIPMTPALRAAEAQGRRRRPGG